MLRVELLGNLGSDPDERFTAAGVPQVTFRVAVNSRRRGQDGEQVERTDWFRVKTMGARAEYVNSQLRKGQRVLVVGRLEIGEWTTREGEQRTSYDVWADDVINLSPREDGQPGQSHQVAEQRAPRPAVPTGAPARMPDEDLDELPF